MIMSAFKKKLLLLYLKNLNYIRENQDGLKMLQYFGIIKGIVIAKIRLFPHNFLEG